MKKRNLNQEALDKAREESVRSLEDLGIPVLHGTEQMILVGIWGELKALRMLIASLVEQGIEDDEA